MEAKLTMTKAVLSRTARGCCRSHVPAWRGRARVQHVTEGWAASFFICPLTAGSRNTMLAQRRWQDVVCRYGSGHDIRGGFCCRDGRRRKMTRRACVVQAQAQTQAQVQVQAQTARLRCDEKRGAFWRELLHTTTTATATTTATTQAGEGRAGQLSSKL